MRKQLLWSAWFASANGLLALLICSIYVWSIFPLDLYKVDMLWKVLIISFLIVTTLASATQLALIGWCLFLLPLSFLYRIPKISIILSVILAAASLILLTVDANVYATFHFHLNSALLSFLVNTQVFNLIGFGARELIEIFLTVLLIIGVEIGLAWFLWKYWIVFPGKRYGKMLVIIALSTIVYSYLMFGLSLRTTPKFAQYTAIFPLYNSILASILPRSELNSSVDRLAESLFQQVRTSHGKVNYPKHDLQFTPPQKPLNLIVVLVDSWRFDSVRPDIMPNTSRFAKEAWEYQQHFSGGNATLPGVFSLFYSIPSWYWSVMLDNQQEPALLTALAKQHYNFQLFTSTSMLLPEFNKTVYIKHPELRFTILDSSPQVAEKLNTAKAVAFLKKPLKQPFFATIYHVQAHSYCSALDAETPFKPFVRECNRLSMFYGKKSRREYLNRYWNALHFVDVQIGQVLATLKTQKLLDNTVVVITGDHGQEFDDNGLNYWEHASNFTRYQVQTPLIVYWPGRAPKIITEQTSHYDVAPFLMRHLLGNTNAISDYSIGQDLLTRKPQDSLIVGSYINLGVIEKNRIIYWYTTGRIEITDLHGKPILGATLPTTTVQKILAMTRAYMHS